MKQKLDNDLSCAVCYICEARIQLETKLVLLVVLGEKKTKDSQTIWELLIDRLVQIVFYISFHFLKGLNFFLQIFTFDTTSAPN